MLHQLHKKIQSAIISVYIGCSVSLVTLGTVFYLVWSGIAMTQSRNADALNAAGFTDLNALHTILDNDILLAIIVVFTVGIGIILPVVWYMLQKMLSVSEDYDRLKQVLDVKGLSTSEPAIVVCSILNEKILFANSLAVKELNYSSYKELFLDSIHDILDLTIFKHIIDDITTSKQDGEYVLKTTARLKTGETRPVCLTIYPVFSRNDTLPRYIHFVLRFPELTSDEINSITN